MTQQELLSLVKREIADWNQVALLQALGTIGLGLACGLAFGISPPTRAELARYAKVHGRSRADTTEAAQKAVRGHGESAPRQRSTPKSLRQIQTPLDVRLAYTKRAPR